MNDASTDPSIFHEPHKQGKKPQTDPSEERAEHTLRHTKTSSMSEEEKLEHSVWDEPGLSSLLTGTMPPDEVTYSMWLEKKYRQTGYFQSWGYTVLIAMLAGPWAIFGALFSGQNTLFGIVQIVFFAPVVEEMMKIAIPMVVIEKKPYMFRSVAQIAVCAMCGGFAFAFIENLLYLNFYIADPKIGIINWRWSVCVALHMGCSLIAGLGLIHVWMDVWKNRCRPRLTLAFPYTVAAMLIHGGYNAFAVYLEAIEFQF